MAESKTLTVTLTPELEAFLDRCLASGRYATREDVVREALEVLQDDEREPDAWKTKRRREIEIGVQQAKAGQLSSGPAFFGQLRQQSRTPR